MWKGACRTCVPSGRHESLGRVIGQALQNRTGRAGTNRSGDPPRDPAQSISATQRHRSRRLSPVRTTPTRPACRPRLERRLPPPRPGVPLLDHHLVRWRDRVVPGPAPLQPARDRAPAARFREATPLRPVVHGQPHLRLGRLLAHADYRTDRTAWRAEPSLQRFRRCSSPQHPPGRLLRIVGEAHQRRPVGEQRQQQLQPARRRARPGQHPDG